MFACSMEDHLRSLYYWT